MLKHPAVKDEKIIHEIDRTGKVTTILLVTTDVECLPNSPLETSLADAIVGYIKDNKIDLARIN